MAEQAKQQYMNLSAEDKKILEDAHRNASNPQHPANPEHAHHGEFAKKLFSKFGNAAVWGAGATFGADTVNSLLGR
ncbi:hypothetical protein EDD37DRAFT_648415 [Exophiala viscosa]|uniref:Uncharacterized protein n=1 Tax=Exophiala viscosa TaxID=2486360 RepID=A0AAN6DUM3_9EURO|nr:hypothetical protein EDD36DRAFT_248510 [Exophiala viscosa]KAI1625965.1 hypothetical protein EDD37DRAFT_648415 [Exophiala viscosa]